MYKSTVIYYANTDAIGDIESNPRSGLRSRKNTSKGTVCSKGVLRFVQIVNVFSVKSALM